MDALCGMQPKSANHNFVRGVGKFPIYFGFLGYLQSSDRGTRQFSDSFLPSVKFPTAHIEFAEEKKSRVVF